MLKHTLLSLSLIALISTLTPLVSAENVHTLDLAQPAKQVILPPGRQHVIQLTNSSQSPQLFRVPELNLAIELPAGKTRFVTIDSGHFANRVLNYRVGQDTAALPTASPSVSSSMDAMNSIDLSNIINYNASYQAQVDAKPSYTGAKPAGE